MRFLGRYLLPRLLQFVVVIFIGTTVVYIIPRLTPIDPVTKQLSIITARGRMLDADAIAAIRKNLTELYGLEGSPVQQYLSFWAKLFRGDFGPSFLQFPTPVTKLIQISLPWTLGLLLVTTLLTWAIGSVLGGVAGSFRKARWAAFLEIIAMSLRPIPYYIMALILVILLCYVFPLFPLTGGYSVGGKVAFTFSFIFEVISHSFLPALSLVLVGFGGWFVQMRAVTSNVVGEDFVSYAETAGLPKGNILFNYTMRNAILPQITGLGLSLGFIFGGALITETVFSYPGIGTLLYQAILGGDYNLVMGITIFSIVTTAITVLLIDLIYPLFDPRVRYA